MPVIERIIDRIVLDEQGCWLVQGMGNDCGYGTINVQTADRRSPVLTHRLTYTEFRGEIPEGLQIDHLCRVRRCANPWHMEIVTPAENTRRGESPSTVARRTNRCARGHSLENAIVYADGKRKCRECRNWRERERRARRREAVSPDKEREQSVLRP